MAAILSSPFLFLEEAMTPKEKLESLLDAEGFRVTLLFGAKGYWRKEDVARWEAWAIKDGQKVYLYSYSTMTSCARKGISISIDQGIPRYFYVDCKEKP